MSDSRFAKCIEPVLHICFILPALFASISRVGQKKKNPSPFQSLCGSSAYPYWCSNEKNLSDFSCAGSRNSYDVSPDTSWYTLLVGTAVAVSCIVGVIWHIQDRKKSKKIRAKGQSTERQRSTCCEQGEGSQDDIKTRLSLHFHLRDNDYVGIPLEEHRLGVNKFGIPDNSCYNQTPARTFQLCDIRFS